MSDEMIDWLMRRQEMLLNCVAWLKSLPTEVMRSHQANCLAQNALNDAKEAKIPAVWESYLAECRMWIDMAGR